MNQRNFGTSIGERVYKMRTAKDLTMQELADRIGSTPATINNIEKGKSSNPTARLIVELADALGVSTDFLLLGKDEFEGLDNSERAFIREYIAFCRSKKK